MISVARIAISWCIPDHTRITMVTIPQRLVCLVMNLMKRQTSYEWDKSLSRACTTHEPNDETRTVYSCTRMRLDSPKPAFVRCRKDIEMDALIGEGSPDLKIK
jgi:hypothetical protein